MNTQLKVSLFLALSTCLLGGPAHAGCFDPYKPSVETFADGSIQTNSYAEGTQMCIKAGFKPENGCRECVPGEFHKCMTGGNWESRGEKCDVRKPLVPYRAATPAPAAKTPTVAEAEKSIRDTPAPPKIQSAAKKDAGSVDLDAVYELCKSQAAAEIQSCIDRELAKQKKRRQ